jgi:hypothetical protein
MPDASLGPICRKNCAADDRACTRVTPGNLHGKEVLGSRVARRGFETKRHARGHALLDGTEVDYRVSSPTRERAERAMRATECRLRCLPRPRKHADLQGGLNPPVATTHGRCRPPYLRSRIAAHADTRRRMDRDIGHSSGSSSAGLDRWTTVLLFPGARFASSPCSRRSLDAASASSRRKCWTSSAVSRWRSSDSGRNVGPVGGTRGSAQVSPAGPDF